MTKVVLRRLWAALAGGVFGVLFGQVYVIWGTLTGKGNLTYTTSYWPGSSYMISVERPIVAISAISFALIGFLIVFSLTRDNNCPQCGAENPLGAKACQFCGDGLDKVKSVMVCSSCNNKYTNGAKFCHVCAVTLMPAEDLEQEILAKHPPSTKKCPACGAINLLQRTLCHNCQKPV